MPPCRITTWSSLSFRSLPSFSFSQCRVATRSAKTTARIGSPAATPMLAQVGDQGVVLGGALAPADGLRGRPARRGPRPRGACRGRRCPPRLRCRLAIVSANAAGEERNALASVHGKSLALALAPEYGDRPASGCSQVWTSSSTISFSIGVGVDQDVARLHPLGPVAADDARRRRGCAGDGG